MGKRVEELESKLSAIVHAETQTRESNTALAISLAGEDTQRSRVSGMRGRVIVSMDVLGMGVEAIVIRLGAVMDRLWLYLTNFARDGPRAACEERPDLAVADFTAASIDTSAAPGTKSIPAEEAVPSKGCCADGPRSCSLWIHGSSLRRWRC